jgi:D-hexose-6-phosphate mutarotase
MQLGSHVFKTRTHVSKTPDVSAIMGLQDVRASSTFNAYKTCEQAATVWLQCSADHVDHLHGTTTVLGDPIARCHVVDRVRPGRTTRQDVPHAIEDIICYF